MILSADCVRQSYYFWILSIEPQEECHYIYNSWEALWIHFLVFLPVDGLSKLRACLQVSLCSILTVCCLSRMQSCSLYQCPGTLGSAEWIRQWVKYLMELRLHHAISMNQVTVNQGFALPVVFQLSIYFDLRVPVCDHLIFHEMMFCEHGERSKRHNQMRKIYGIQARETGTAQTLNFCLQALMSLKLLLYWMLPPVTLWAARAWDSWWRQP